MRAPRWARNSDVIGMTLLIVGVGTIIVGGFRGDQRIMWAGFAVGGVGAATLLEIWSLMGQSLTRVGQSVLWPHQLAQLAVTGLGCAGAWRWYGWPAAAIVIATASLVATVAGAEGRKVERRKVDRQGVIKLPGLHVNG